jgi:hypothetical protein
MRIVNMYVMDDMGERIGTFVVDIDALLDLYQRTHMAGSPEPIDIDQIPQGNIGSLQWVRDHQGTVHLRVITNPQDIKPSVD